MPRKKSDSESSTAKPRIPKKSVTEQQTLKPRTKRATKPKRLPSETTTPGSSLPLTEAEIHNRIATRAYQLFLNQGGHHGQDVQHWTQAEQEIRGERIEREESIPV